MYLPLHKGYASRFFLPKGVRLTDMRGSLARFSLKSRRVTPIFTELQSVRNIRTIVFGEGCVILTLQRF